MHRSEWRRLVSIFMTLLFVVAAVPHVYAYESSPYLSELRVSGGSLTEGFDQDAYSYTIIADEGSSSAKITAIPEDPDATVTINGDVATQSSLTLEGTNTASIHVTAADGEHGAIYTVELVAPAITEPVDPSNGEPVGPSEPVDPSGAKPVSPFEEALAARSNNAYLWGIDGDFDLLTPYLDRTVFHYTVQPYPGNTSVYLVFEAEDPSAVIRVNGEKRNDVTLSFSNGIKDAAVEITAADGVTKNIYTFSISRTSNNADLFVLETDPDTGRFDPEFDPDIITYDAIPTGEYPYVFFWIRPMDAYGTVKVDGMEAPPWDNDWYYWAVGTADGLSTTAKIEITASDGTSKKTYTVRYAAPSVKLGTPTLTVTAQKYDSVRISWNAISGAKGYEVYRSTSSSGTYTKIATVDGSLDYTDTGLKSGQRYYYKVRAYSLSYNGKIYGSFSSYKYATPSWGTVKPTASVTHKTVSLQWNAVADATGYEVLRGTSSKGTFVSIANVTELSYTDKDVTAGKTYYYKVRPLDASGASTKYGPESAVLTAAPVWASVKFSSPSVTHKTVTLRWNAVAGATGYEVLRSTSSTGTYVSIAANVTEPTYTDTGVTAGKTYYYKVRPLDASGETVLYGTASAYQSATPVWPSIKFTSSASVTHKTVTLRWNAVAGATGYEVLRSTSSKGAYVSIAANVTETAFTDTGVVSGKTYYYKVRPLDASGEATLYGTESAYQSATPVWPSIKFTSSASVTHKTVTLRWNAVAGATGYEVLRSTSSKGAYVNIATNVTETTFTDTGVVSGKTYYYKVRPLDASGETTLYGTASAYQSATPVWPSIKFTSSASVTHKTVTLRWNAVAGATGYEVLRSTSSKGAYASITANVTETTFTDTGVISGKTYYYKVRPLDVSGETTLYGAESAYQSATPVWPSIKFTSSASVTHKTVTLRWNAVAGATGYEVLRSTSSKGAYASIAANVTETTFTDTGVAAGKTYYYKVRPLDASGETTLYGTESAYQSATPVWGTARFGTATPTYQSIGLKWNTVAGATGYEVQRSTSSKGTYAVIANVDEASFTDTDVVTGKTYYYKVRPLDASGEPTLYGPVSAYQAVTAAWPQVSIKVVSGTYNSVLVTWNAVAGATAYEVQRSTSSKGVYTVIAEGVTETSFTDTALVTGKTYYYKVRPYDGSVDPRVYGPVSSYKYAAPAWPSLTLQAASGGFDSVKLSWNTVAGAAGYEVYRADSSRGTYRLVATATASSLTDEGLSTGKTYYYKVRAFDEADGNRVYGGYSSYKYAKPVPAAPVGLTASSAQGGVALDWDGVRGVTMYEVYRATSKSGSYTKIATTAESQTLSTGLSAGRTYYYKVRAYTLSGKDKIYSSYSAIVSGKK